MTTKQPGQTETRKSPILDATAAKLGTLQGQVLVPSNVPHILIVGILTAFFVGLVLVIILGTFTRTERVSGHLVPTQGVIKLYPKASGFITDQFLKEGSSINASKELFVIEAEGEDAKGTIQYENNIASINEKISLLEERLKLRKTQYEAELKVLDIENQNIFQTSQAIDENVRFQKQISLSQKQSVDDSEDLRKQGHISRVEFESRVQNYIISQQKIANLERDLALQKGAVKNIDAKKTLLAIELNNELAQLNGSLLALQQEKLDLESAARFTVISPIEGTIASIYETVGKYVAPGDLLATILPQNSTLVAELFVPSKAIVFVNAGQKIRLSYDAFPQQYIGPLFGEVVSVTKTALLPSEGKYGFNFEEPTYRVVAKIFDQKIVSDNQTMPLQAGMRLNATIILDELSLIDWMLATTNS